ncbi:hypothetical protein ABK040_001968 [Willaertia magna]
MLNFPNRDFHHLPPSTAAAGGSTSTTRNPIQQQATISTSSNNNINNSPYYPRLSDEQEQQQDHQIRSLQQTHQQQQEEEEEEKNFFQNFHSITIPSTSTTLHPTSSFNLNSFFTPVSTPFQKLNQTSIIGELTVGEIDGELIHIGSQNDRNIAIYLHKGGAIYPNIIIPHLNMEELQKNTLQNNLQKDLQKENLFTKMYNYLFSNNSGCKRELLKMEYVKEMEWIPNEMKFAICLPSYNHVTNNVTNNVINNVENHVEEEDCIYFYDLQKEEFTNQILKHSFQKNVTCMKFYNNSILGICCDNGICIWNINKRLQNKMSQTSQKLDISKNGIMTFIPTTHKMTCLSWKGNSLINKEGIFATSSIFDNKVYIYRFNSKFGDFELVEIIDKYLPNLNVGVKYLEFSKDGNYLIIFYTNCHFKIIDFRNSFTNSFKNSFKNRKTQLWTCFKKEIKSIQWTDQNDLFLVFEDSYYIHVLKNSNYLLNNQNYDLFLYLDYISLKEYHPTTNDDLKVNDILEEEREENTKNNQFLIHSSDDDDSDNEKDDDEKEEDEMVCGGIIKEILMDKERLIVSFESSPFLAVLQVIPSKIIIRKKREKIPSFIRPIGYLRGPSSFLLDQLDSGNKEVEFDPFEMKLEKVTCNNYLLKSWNIFDKGSLISVVWSGNTKDKIGIYPFYY